MTRICRNANKWKNGSCSCEWVVFTLHGSSIKGYCAQTCVLTSSVDWAFDCYEVEGHGKYSLHPFKPGLSGPTSSLTVQTDSQQLDTNANDANNVLRHYYRSRFSTQQCATCRNHVVVIIPAVIVDRDPHPLLQNASSHNYDGCTTLALTTALVSWN